MGVEPFPPGFFDRVDRAPDAGFYAVPRFVTHIDDDAIAAVGSLYEELGIHGDVLDLMGSWVSHFRVAPAHLIVLGMNEDELAANPSATGTIVHDLNAEPVVPLDDEAFDAVVCCVSVDYLVRPVEVFREVRRLLRPRGLFVCTFSNRVFPDKVIRGWLAASDDGRAEIVATYFRASGGWNEPTVQRRTPTNHRGDPLVAVWATRTSVA